MGIKPNLIGKKFGRLTVISSLPSVKRESERSFRSMWECVCDCGNKKSVSALLLNSGKTKSCGCLRKEYAKNRMTKLSGSLTRLSSGESTFNQIYAAYRAGALNKDMLFELSKDQFKILTQGNCEYCGCGPSNIHKNNVNAAGTYTYNGIDRKQNEIGYTLENCVSCCKICNFAKRTMDYADFINHIEKMYLFLFKKI